MNLIDICEKALGNCDDLELVIKTDYSFGKFIKISLKVENVKCNVLVSYEELDHLETILQRVIEEIKEATHGS